ncbi:MAG: hypothetical protein ACTSU2_07290 [Promethearchaeota archaeon]
MIKDAKILEKRSPDVAKKVWLKICEFALEFSKQPGVKRDLRLKIWKQISNILNRLKENENIGKSEYFNYLESKNKAGNELAFGGHQGDSKGLGNYCSHPSELDFNLFPSPPKEESETQSTDSTDSTNTNMSQEQLANIGTNSTSTINTSIQKDSQDLNKTSTPKSKFAFYEKILKMEDELKKMPDSFKEINAEHYTPDKSIIPMDKEKITKALKPDNKDNSSSVIDLKTEQILNEADINDLKKITTKETIDPYRGTKDFKEIKDPLGGDGLKNIQNVQEHVCYACGAKVEPGMKRCPNCGAEL